MLSHLSALVDSSMVRREPDLAGASHRFTMLDTVREYAAERLEASGEKEQAERFHASYFLALAERAEPHLEGGEQASWLKILEAEHDNIRAAYLYYLRSGDTVSLVSLAGALRRFWYLQGYLTEGRTWLATTLQHRDQLDPALLAKVLHGLGTLEWAVGRLAEAGSYFRESLALSRSLHDTLGVANMLNNLGIVALPQGDYEGAVAFHNESLALYRQLGDRWYVALAISNLGLVALDKGDYAEARSLLEESLAMRRESGRQAGHRRIPQQPRRRRSLPARLRRSLRPPQHKLGNVPRPGRQMERSPRHLQSGLRQLEQLPRRDYFTRRKPRRERLFYAELGFVRQAWRRLRHRRLRGRPGMPAGL